MNDPPSPAEAPRNEPGWAAWAAAAVILAGAFAAYHDGLHGAFLYDDRGSIANNPTIRHLASALRPPRGGLPVSGRPLVNLSFALNYAAGGMQVAGYHAANIAIHALAGLALWGVARRTLSRSARLHEALGGHCAAAAFFIALLWTVHPLATEAVTYLSQRAESLMGLFYLLTLYCFIRGADGRPSRLGRGAPWFALAWLSCIAGMASKEVMVTAPVMVFLYDRTFVAGSFGAAWRARRKVYLALASTWVLLAWLVATNGGRGGTAGYGSSVTWWAYAFTQFRAVAHYLRLCLWPHPLVFDYGLILGGPPLAMLGDFAAVAALAAATAVLVRRGSPWGFLGAWYLLILAPSSSVVPVATEIIAEHRAYLPLAAVLAAAVCGAYAAARRLGMGPRTLGVAGFAAGISAAAVLTAATVRRNRVYENVLVLWADTVAKVPGNVGARNNYGNALAERGRIDEAIAQYRAALRLAPAYDDPHYNLGNALAAKGRWAEAVGHYLAALKFRPGDAAIHYGLGSALHHLGRDDEAERQYEQALADESDSAEVWYNLGNAFLDGGRMALAARAFGRAVALRPDYVDALVNYAAALGQTGHAAEAIQAFRSALRLEPDAADVHNDLGGLLADGGRFAEAEAQFEEALRLKPGYPEASHNLEKVRAMEAEKAGP